MVFFQAALLGGYAYAHATTAWLGIRRQTILHLALLPSRSPSCLSASTRAACPGARPTPCWACSSCFALGGPALLRGERDRAAPAAVVHAHRAPGRPRPVLPLRRQQSRQHARAARLPVADRAAAQAQRCRVARADTAVDPRLSPARRPDRPLRRRRREAERRADRGRTDAGGMAPAPPPSAEAAERSGRAPTIGRRLYWVALAFAPSSLLLGVTTYVTTDIAALPLLWVLPLAIYLLSFIIAFGRWPAALHRAVSGGDIAPRPPRDVLHDLALPAAELGDGALALSPALRRRPRLPWRAGDRPALAPAPHRVLPPHLRGRRARRNRQCADRAPGLQLAPGVPARDGARVCARGGGPRGAGRRARPAAFRGAAARGDPARARALLGEPHPPGRHRLPRPRVRPRLPPHHDVDQPGRAAREQGS